MRLTYTILASVSVMALTAVSVAQGAPTPNARGQVIRDFARLTFEWPEPTLFTAKTSGKDLILTFDRQADFDMRQILQQLQPYVLKAEKWNDGKTLVLSLNEPHRIRTFISDNISGIDLLDIKPPAKVASKKKPDEKSKPVVLNAFNPDEARLAELTPAAGEEAPVDSSSAEPSVSVEVPTTGAPEIPITAPEEAEAVSAPVAEQPATSSVDESTTALPQPETVTAIPVAPVSEAPSTQEKVAETIPPATDDFSEEGEARTTRGADTNISLVPIELPHDAEQSEEAQSTENMDEAPVERAQDEGDTHWVAENKVIVSADDEAGTIRLPLKERTAMAVFTRMNSLWIILDAKLELDVSDFSDLKSGVVDGGKIYPHDKATIIRVDIADNVRADIRQEIDKQDIAILLSTKKQELNNPLEVTVNTEPPALPHVFLPVLEPGNMIELVDPVIGDTMMITPVYTLEQGVERTRDFIEFTLLQSTQGVVVAKKSDATEVVDTRNGLRVSVKGGAHISPYQENARALSSTLSTASVSTLFPHEQWKLEPNRSMKITMDRLFNASVLSKMESEQNLARLRMAQLYLGDGYAAEAIGMLDNIRRTNPSYYRSAKLSAMRGAANFLMYRFTDAARDFASAELNNNPEITYWRDMIADLLGSPDRQTDFLAVNAAYISYYPPVFRQRLAIVAADRAIAAKQHNSALQIFDTLEKDGIIEPIQPYVDFLKARIAADNGLEIEALEVWDRLAADSPNKFVQARAEFSRILWKLDNNTITREDAAERLERLRLAWHGDGLELQVVQLLGDLYLEKRDYVNAMRVWQIAVTGFRNTGPAVEMENKMHETFVTLFNEGIADQMPPLQALALYYEYRNFTPPGPQGVQMIEKLADRLIGVDLLSSAAQLLEQQMRTQLEKEERSRIGTKLASIYLLNGQPKRSMQALQESVYGENPILMRIKRNQIAAEAMMKLGRPDEALATLGQDDSPHAERIRAMIYWNERDWDRVISSIESMLKRRPDPTQQLSYEEGEFVLRLALAYVFQNDISQLQYMRDYFMPLMRNNPNIQAFDFITTPDIQPDTRNFDELLAALSKTRTFLENYKAQIEFADAAMVEPAVDGAAAANPTP